MLWLGDNLYLQQPDLFDPQSMAARYRRQRAFEPLQTLLTATTHLAIWDDHDFGPNDSDTSYVFKGETLKLFTRYWPNPTFGLPEVPGAFGAARYGDVLFFLLDDRYYRYPDRWPDGPDKTMFGARQLEWLKQALVSAPAAPSRSSRAEASSGAGANRFEGWHQFATERRAFAEWLDAQKIDRVLFVSGDRHFSRAPQGRPTRCVSALRIHVESAHLTPTGAPRRAQTATIRTSCRERSSSNGSSG